MFHVKHGPPHPRGAAALGVFLGWYGRMGPMPSAEMTPAGVHEPARSSGAEPVRPTREDEVAAAGSELIGGPIGRRALLGTTWWTPVRVVTLVMIGMFALGLVQKAPCYH